MISISWFVNGRTISGNGPSYWSTYNVWRREGGGVCIQASWGGPIDEFPTVETVEALRETMVKRYRANNTNRVLDLLQFPEVETETQEAA